MTRDDYQGWDEFLAAAIEESTGREDEHIKVVRRELEEVARDLSRLVYATERHYKDNADRLVYEHRERFRHDLLLMNNVRIRLNAILRGAS